MELKQAIKTIEYALIGTKAPYTRMNGKSTMQSAWFIRVTEAWSVIVNAVKEREIKQKEAKAEEPVADNPSPVIAYICDRLKCGGDCPDWCKHTLDIKHAKNFEDCGGGYYEEVENENN